MCHIKTFLMVGEEWRRLLKKKYYFREKFDDQIKLAFLPTVLNSDSWVKDRGRAGNGRTYSIPHIQGMLRVR